MTIETTISTVKTFYANFGLVNFGLVINTTKEKIHFLCEFYVGYKLNGHKKSCMYLYIFGLIQSILELIVWVSQF